MSGPNRTNVYTEYAAQYSRANHRSAPPKRRPKDGDVERPRLMALAYLDARDRPPPRALAGYDLRPAAVRDGGALLPQAVEAASHAAPTSEDKL